MTDLERTLWITTEKYGISVKITPAPDGNVCVTASGEDRSESIRFAPLEGRINAAIVNCCQLFADDILDD